MKFGFSPKKRSTPLTSEQKVLRAAKAKETREKNHTMGRRQKAALDAAAIAPATPPVASSSANGSKVAV